MTPEEELSRIEVVLIEALNALHTVRRQIASSDIEPARPEWMPIAEAAYKLGVNPKTAWKMLNGWARTGLKPDRGR